MALLVFLGRPAAGLVSALVLVLVLALVRFNVVDVDRWTSGFDPEGVTDEVSNGSSNRVSNRVSNGSSKRGEARSDVVRRCYEAAL